MKWGYYCQFYGKKYYTASKRGWRETMLFTLHMIHPGQCSAIQKVPLGSTTIRSEPGVQQMWPKIKQKRL